MRLRKVGQDRDRTASEFVFKPTSAQQLSESLPSVVGQLVAGQ